MVTSQQPVVNSAGAEPVSSPFPGVVLGKFSWKKLKGQGLWQQLSDMDDHIQVDAVSLFA